MLWFCLTSLCDWSRKLAPSSQPIRCKIKNNRSLLTRVFPRFSQYNCFYFEFSLALKVFLLLLIGCCDYFGFWYYDTQPKNSLFTVIGLENSSHSHPIGCKLKLFVIWSPQFSCASSNLWWLIIVVSLWLFRSIIFHFHVCWWYCCLFYC